MRRYGSLRHAEKVRLALQILADVCEHWDREQPRKYPGGLPSFDEYVHRIAGELTAIEWADPGQPRAGWCDCPRPCGDPTFAPDGACPCGEPKHHWHCAFCRGLVQVG
jgi:hypothetical protein